MWTIAPAVFSAAVLEIAETKAAGKSLEDKVKALSADWKDAPLGHYLAGAAATIGGSTDKFVDGLGEWFDGQMQSLANTYRRLSRWTLWALGLVVAFAFNVDTIQIADSLYDDEHTRAAVVAFADELELCSEQNTDGSEPSEEDVDLGEQPVAVCDTVDGIELGRGQLNDLSELGIPVLGEWTSPFAGRDLANCGHPADLAAGRVRFAVLVRLHSPADRAASPNVMSGRRERDAVTERVGDPIVGCGVGRPEVDLLGFAVAQLESGSRKPSFRSRSSYISAKRRRRAWWRCGTRRRVAGTPWRRASRRAAGGRWRRTRPPDVGARPRPKFSVAAPCVRSASVSQC